MEYSKASMPHILINSKPPSGGYPIGAVLSPREKIRIVTRLTIPYAQGINILMKTIMQLPALPRNCSPTPK